MKRSEIKVLHLITELPIGGAQDNTLLSVRGLKKLGYQVDLAAAPDGELESLAREYSDNVYHIKNFSANAISPVKNIEAILEICNLLKDNKYDIIHTHSSTAGICGRIAAKISKVPIIIHTVHGFPFHDFMKPLKKNFLILLEKACANICDHMITVSNLNKEEIVERKISTIDKLTNVYSGIDLDKFNINKSKEEIKAELNIPEEDLVVGLIARMSNQKAPEYFIEAAKLILKEKPNVTFLMVGDGPLKDKLIEQIGDETRIRMMGARKDIPEILKTLDIFALSSIYEGLGRAMTEAMICKKPIVAPNVNGIPEVVIDGDTGFLVSPRDSKGLAEKILVLLNDEKLRNKMGLNAHHKVVPAFSDKKMVEDIDSLYRKILLNKLNINIETNKKEKVKV
ncbi:MAG: glycosyltransferase family 4 protein [Vampirovibrionia bacterium]